MAVRLSFIFCFIIAFVLAYLGSSGIDHSSKLRSYNEWLNVKLKTDKDIIRKYLNSADDRIILAGLDKSPFFIEVYRNDSIIYWNDQTLVDENITDDIIPIEKIGDSLTYGNIRLNPSSNICIDRQKTCYFTENWKMLPSDTKNADEVLTLGNVKIGVLPMHDQMLHRYKQTAWLFLFLGFVLAGLYFLRQYDLSQFSIYKLLLGIALFPGFGLLHLLPSFYHYFGNPMGKTGQIAMPNIYMMYSGLWIFGCMIYILQLIYPNIGLHKKYPVIYNWITGFYTFFIFGLGVFIIEKWVLNSPANLEIESLFEFNSLSFLVIVSCIIMMVLIFQTTQMLFEWMQETNLKGLNKLLVLATGWIGAYLVLRLLGMLHVPAWIFTIFVMAYSLILDAYTEKGDRKITYLIWWQMLFSGFIAVVLFYFGLKKDIAVRNEFIKDYFVEYDNRIIEEMEQLNDSLVRSDVFNKIASLETPSKLDVGDFNDYIFNTSDHVGYSVELFDKKTGATLFSNHFADYYKLLQSFENSRLAGKLIYHNPIENRYFSRFEIARSSPVMGSWYLFVIYTGENKRATAPDKSLPDFGYAIFHHNKLIQKNDGLQSPPEYSAYSQVFVSAIQDNYSYVVSNPSDAYRLVSWKKVSGLIKPISLFSFIFTLSGLFILLLTLINTKLDFLPQNLSLKFGDRSSLKTKIQLAIILLIMVTFLIIGLITGIYFKNLILANQNSRHSEDAESILNNIKSDLQNLDDSEYGLNFLINKLKDISYIHDKDLSLHDHTGKLVASTSAKNNLMRIPFDLWNLNVNHKNSSTKEIKKSKTDREYLPLYLGENYINRNQPFAFIGIDHKSYSASANILDFLSTILNAYIFLFLIAGAIAITIANSITQPLSILTEKLKKFKLGKSNELLEWKSNDEIGTLIHDYNNLTLELERSAGLLAKTERDMAWREMAKQVAHEIKNPLTPMKLSIQYLERATKSDPKNAQELIPRISSTLIEQIDNLSQIANEFSNFAAMPQASNEKIILNEIVETIHDLFRKREDMEFNMIEPIDDLYVFADRNHIIRILNNLVKNAIQAIPDNKRGKIEIELKREGNDAVIRISDNGTGIPDHMKDKVFTPNFTTKSSGTGLGLAISANMIDSFNGRIYFDTKVGQGTDFYVAIPLMRLDDYFGEENRVSLD
jgi:signal transduction histidine kinase